jgi:hypothetical protein
MAIPSVRTLRYHFPNYLASSFPLYLAHDGQKKGGATDLYPNGDDSDRLRDARGPLELCWANYAK